MEKEYFYLIGLVLSVLTLFNVVEIQEHEKKKLFRIVIQIVVIVVYVVMLLIV